MDSFKSLKEVPTLTEIELTNLEIPKFQRQKDDFTSWFFKVERVFTCYDPDDEESFKEVILRL